MGLAAPKRRTKISNDPNNTAWTRDIDRFGHKILSKHGWKPGDYLGVENAQHAAHYTAASASHVKIVLKDDNLGLGARGGKETAGTFGLFAFNNILGKLNGKSSDELSIDQKIEEGKRLRRYVGQKYGLEFVHGGFLEGTIKDSIVSTKLVEVSKDLATPDAEAVVKREKNKKRKHVEDQSEEQDRPRLKKKKSLPDLRAASMTESASATATETDDAVTRSDSAAKRKETTDEKRQRRAEKEARREARRLRKEEKLRKKEERRASDPEEAESTTTIPESASIPSETRRSDSPASSGTSTPTVLGGRHLARQRFIMAKKRSGMDPQALREILMVKTSG